MIIMVEDYQIVSMHMKRVLERAGYDIPITFASGEELIDFLENSHVDLVLMDVMLDGELDGIDTIGILRTKHSFPVIFLTALTDVNSIKRIASIKNSTMLTKPFDEEQLVSTVQKAVCEGFR